MRLGGQELLIIIIVVFILFGGALIPRVFKAGKNSFKTAQNEIEQAKEEFKADEQSKDEEE